MVNNKSMAIHPEVENVVNTSFMNLQSVEYKAAEYYLQTETDRVNKKYSGSYNQSPFVILSATEYHNNS
jgi:hypothetical protein